MDGVGLLQSRRDIELMARALCFWAICATATGCIHTHLPRLTTTAFTTRRSWYKCNNWKSNCFSNDAAAAAASSASSASAHPSNSKTPQFEALEAAVSDPPTKPNSLLCVDCDGNGNKKCKHCKGTGVNLEDLFNGQFKAGSSCWLCGGKKEVLCGNCNGAGFIGGFMSTFDP